MSETKIFYVFRHGETDWNKATRLQGNTDIPLNETGRKQALVLRDFFTENPVDIFISSDLGRARETAEIALGDLQVPISLYPGLRETNLGQAEGLTYDEIIDRFGQKILDDWYAAGTKVGYEKEIEDARFPGGESKKEHLSRVLSTLTGFARATPYARVGVATHGGTLRRLIHHMRPDLENPVMVGNCSLYEMRFEVGSGLWSVDINVKCKV